MLKPQDQAVPSDCNAMLRTRKEIGRAIDRVNHGAQASGALEGELAEGVAALSEAAGQLREELARLQ